MKKLYIAYGSNMDEDMMAVRCPGARMKERAILEGYRLIFRGDPGRTYASIDKDEDGKVPVLIWEITPEDEVSLDDYEDFPLLYYKEELEIVTEGKPQIAMAYIMYEDQSLNLPEPAYYKNIEESYRKFGFDIHILKKAYEDSAKCS